VVQTAEFSAEAVKMICDMGFELSVAISALRAAKGDVSVAIDQICGGGGGDGGGGNVDGTQSPVAPPPMLMRMRRTTDDDDGDEEEELERPPALENCEDLLDVSEVDESAVEAIVDEGCIDFAIDEEETLLHKAVKLDHWKLVSKLLPPKPNDAHREAVARILFSGSNEDNCLFYWIIHAAFPKPPRADKSNMHGVGSKGLPELDDKTRSMVTVIARRVAIFYLRWGEVLPPRSLNPRDHPVMKDLVQSLKRAVEEASKLTKECNNQEKELEELDRRVALLEAENAKMRDMLNENEVIVNLEDDDDDDGDEDEDENQDDEFRTKY
jgi:hypothetical protein